MIEVALVGCGHMGAHHARVMARNPRCRLVGVVDLIPERAARLARELGTEACARVPEAELVVVATPTHSHRQVAAPLLSRGSWCLVEKPLAATVSDASALGAPRLAVGHLERFNPALRAAGELRPRYVEARRVGPGSARGRDVDVVFDRMIHDLDLVLAWGGAAEVIDAVGVAVLGEEVDTASVRLRCANGLTASLVASRVATRSLRELRVYESGRFTRLDLGQGVVQRQGRSLPVSGPDALSAQWEAMLDAVQGRGPLPVSAAAGVAAVELAARVSAATRVP